GAAHGVHGAIDVVGQRERAAGDGQAVLEDRHRAGRGHGDGEVLPAIEVQDVGGDDGAGEGGALVDAQFQIAGGGATGEVDGVVERAVAQVEEVGEVRAAGGIGPGFEGKAGGEVRE